MEERIENLSPLWKWTLYLGASILLALFLKYDADHAPYFSSITTEIYFVLALIYVGVLWLCRSLLAFLGNVLRTPHSPGMLKRFSPLLKCALFLGASLELGFLLKYQEDHAHYITSKPTYVYFIESIFVLSIFCFLWECLVRLRK